MGYNYSSTNHIKSGQVLEAPTHPFSIRDRGANTMSDHTPTTQFIKLSARADDLTGRRFGRLVALGPVGVDKSHHVIWLCRCDCGNEKPISSHDFRRPNTRSCGCLSAENNQRNYGLKNSPIHTVWRSMIKRCFSKNHPSYSNYGGRGITVCTEWRESFRTFYDYVSQLSHYGEEGYTLDRIDNDGNYEPGNVRWATMKQQSRNKRTNRVLTLDGVSRPLIEWIEITGLRENTLRKRLARGWSVRDALLTKPQSKK